MRKIVYTVSILALIAITGHAQDIELWGTSSLAGNLANGTSQGSIFSVNNNNLTANYFYQVANPGRRPIHPGLTNVNGEFFGVTTYGGAYDLGIIFKYNPLTNNFTNVYNFKNPEGAFPLGDLLLYNNKLYGITQGGGTGAGNLFEFDPATNTFSSLHVFEYASGFLPYAGLTYYDGKLFGTTYGGGKNGAGTIYSFDPASRVYTKQYDFDFNTGGQPKAPLTVYNNFLLGTTSTAFSPTWGVLFAYDYIAKKYYILHKFLGADGGHPSGKLIQSGNNFYGTTGDGGTMSRGVLFSFTPATQLYTKIYDFNGPNGSNPGELYSKNDTLYGNCFYGGSADIGVLYSFSLLNNTQTVLHNFTGADGIYPTGFLANLNDTLYGLTQSGGSFTNGVIFKYALSNAAFQKNLDLGINNGTKPSAGLVWTGDNKFYGTTETGGAGNYGTIFSFDPLTGTYNKFFDMSTASGYSCRAQLTPYNNKLIGVASQGGSHGQGSIFEIDTVTKTVTDDFGFNNYPDNAGSNPSGGLAIIGNFGYGVLQYGGPNGYGTIYKFDLGTKAFYKLYEFNNTKGSSPVGTLVNYNGKLYGITSAGGIYSNGVLFSYDYNTGQYARLFDFNFASGSWQTSGLTEMNGILYGLTSYGGTDSAGVFFRFDPSVNAYQKILDFDSSNGAFPKGSLLKASDQKLYGFTFTGGTHNNGVIFSYDPATNSYAIVNNLDAQTSGYAPAYGALAERPLNCAQPVKLNVKNITATGAVLNWSIPGKTNPLSQVLVYEFASRKKVVAAFTSQLTYTLSGLKPGIRYVWLVGDVCLQPDSSIVFSRLKSFFTTSGSTISSNIAGIQDTKPFAFPNPATGFTNIYFTANAAELYAIDVKDMNGKLLIHTSCSAHVGQNSVPLHLEAFANGNYFVTITGNGNTGHFTVLKVK